ncbi:hypothetical protein AcV5_003903 [Taiwanofungus camphoratus]|nr:hypothetical protein AcV5_003903 [Antrodia cinnamomea]
MSTRECYRYFQVISTCGIPSVTLDGKKQDWEKLLDRVDRLDGFGEEPRTWATMLRPVLRRFVSVVGGQPDIAFWDNIVHRATVLCGPDDISGWTTAFCV